MPDFEDPEMPPAKEMTSARRSAAACSPVARRYQCDECRDTGYFGDNGPGIRGNNEYTECDCRRKLKTDDEKWRDHFVYPIALEMKRRGIGELRIKLKDTGKADFELIPENAQAMASADTQTPKENGHY
jgi:hypothetical protein